MINNNFNLKTLAFWYKNTYYLNNIFINYTLLELVIYNVSKYDLNNKIKANFNSKSNKLLNESSKLKLELNNKLDKKSDIKSKLSYNLLDLYYNRFLYINNNYLFKIIKYSFGLKRINPKFKFKNCNSYFYGKFKEIISRNLQNLINLLKFIDSDILRLFKIK